MFVIDWFWLCNSVVDIVLFFWWWNLFICVLIWCWLCFCCCIDGGACCFGVVGFGFWFCAFMMIMGLNVYLVVCYYSCWYVVAAVSFWFICISLLIVLLCLLLCLFDMFCGGLFVCLVQFVYLEDLIGLVAGY